MKKPRIHARCPECGRSSRNKDVCIQNKRSFTVVNEWMVKIAQYVGREDTIYSCEICDIEFFGDGLRVDRINELDFEDRQAIP